MDAAIYSGSGYSTNTVDFAGNTSEGQFVNITTGIAPYGQSCFYFNTTGIGKPVGCLVVDVRTAANTSILSATALIASIATDTDLAPLVTITQPDTHSVTITSKAAGDNHNWNVAETLASGTWLYTAHFQGGSFGGIGNMGTSARTLVEQLPLFLVLILLMVFVKLVI